MQPHKSKRDTPLDFTLLPTTSVINDDDGTQAKDYLVYCIRSESRPNKTYVGVTNNWPRRIRQHNKEIKGGAKSTSHAGPWKAFIHVRNFTHTQALQLEWAWKHRRVGGSGPGGRIRTLEALLKCKRWTSRAPLMADLDVCIECSWSESQYETFETPTRNGKVSRKFDCAL